MSVTVLVWCMTLLLLVGCGAGGTSAPLATVTPAITATPNGVLPTFSDWRVAYAGLDSRLHVVSLDGKSDVVGSLLPPLNSSGPTLLGGASPDGHRVAYISSHGLTLLSLLADDPAKSVIENPQVAGFDLVWSPDGATVALTTGDALELADAATGTVAPIPGWQHDFHGRVVGWLDQQRILVVSTKGLAPTSITLLAIAVTTGAAQSLVTLPITLNTGVDVSLSPDRTQALVRNHAPTGNNPDHPPLIELVNTGTGQVRSLPGIAKAIGFLEYPVTWKPGTQLAAATPSSESFDLARPETQSWLLDLAHDTAAKLTMGQFCLGWAPDTDALLLSTSLRTEANGQAHTLSVATVTNGTLGQRQTLTTAASSFPFLGFVRTQ